MTGGNTMDETREILKSILHQLELLNAKYDSLDKRIGNLDKRMGNMEDQLANISGQIALYRKMLTDHNHRIADIEQELRISKQ
jgi:chromosome segregation ATPase